MTQSQLWINKIEGELLQKLDLASAMKAPKFPFENLSSLIQTTLNTDPLSIKIGSAEWKTEDHFLTGFGSSPITLMLEISPLVGTLYWIMPIENIQKWISWIKDEEQVAFELENPDLIKGIYKYTLLEVLLLITKMEEYNEFSFHLKEKVQFERAAYSIDVSISQGEETIWGRLLISETLKRSLSNHYALKKPTLSTLSHFKEVTLLVSIQNGSISLTQNQLSSLNEGDFLIIEDAHYHPTKEGGSLKIFIANTPIFLAKPKDNRLKILDYIFPYEEEVHG